MQRLKNALRDRRGETIVEVLVSFVLLMLFLALFTVSLRYARRASVQAQTIRDNAYKLTSAIYPVNDADGDWKDDAKITMDFGRFTVKDVQLQNAEAKVKKDENDESSEGEIIAAHTFTRYYKAPADNKEDTAP